MLEHYNPILKTIRGLCPTAHIGGGAVRDSLLERPIRDIDLFLDDAFTDDAATLLRSKFGYVKVGQWTSYEHFSDPAVVRLAKFEKADETIPVCLIGLKETCGMQGNLSRFDFGVCMAAWDGDDVCTAPEYFADVHGKTFTLCRADNQPQSDYSLSRFHKLTADRYSGWDLVVPAEFEELAREHTLRKVWYRDPDSDALKYREAGPQQLKPKAR
ncbi:hypothetical protein ACH79_06415 [Bradyrhizobium sp. CCBAU 051011]|uniref:hypothetical protein n=1 Tax=Bradyrhizobium sp. CCBAU 051011 TaxID=858422 RepID=UPI0013741BAA|nr:hypothetical protein [Bradyrhizobium sp. CCBAU 051011]QHO72312.1 hypothetical protein ACH79_06415 [Bradyrhizobium sp. CCBAU 051011]